MLFLLARSKIINTKKTKKNKQKKHKKTIIKMSTSYGVWFLNTEGSLCNTHRPWKKEELKRSNILLKAFVHFQILCAARDEETVY